MKLRRSSPGQRSPTRRERVRDERQTSLPAAFSYHASRSDQRLANTGRQLGSDALKPAARKIRSFWMQRYGVAVLGIVVILSIFNVLSLSTNVKIEPLVTGSNISVVRPQSDYQMAAAKLLSQSIWNRNKLSFNAASVTTKLQAQFPEIQAVSVELPLLGHRPIVYIQSSQPVLILHGAQGSFLIGDDGKALVEGTSFPGIDVPQVTDQSGLQVQLNHQVLASTEVAFIQTVVGQLAAKNFRVTSMTLPASSSELDVSISGQPYFVKFNVNETDARQQVGTYLALQASLAQQNIVPTKYVDVRVDGRAYYL